jgi:Holliday junction resolvase RusA-like endonuclease
MESKLAIEKLKQRIDDPIDCDIHAQFTFYFPESVYYTKKGDRSAKLPDLSNLYELPQDVMQDMGIIKNDTLICSHDGSRREAVEGSNYYLEIILRRFV